MRERGDGTERRLQRGRAMGEGAMREGRGEMVAMVWSCGRRDWRMQPRERDWRKGRGAGGRGRTRAWVANRRTDGTKKKKKCREKIGVRLFFLVEGEICKNKKKEFV
jgi:hypothetical protein